MKPVVEIIIPSWNNLTLLLNCIQSIRCSLFGPAQKLTHIIVVNNGAKELSDHIPQSEEIRVLSPNENLGWEGGLAYGLEHSTAPIVVFCNDDIHMVTGRKDWLWRMVSLFNDPKVGAVGPSSNFVMGKQSIFLNINEPILDVPFLIGFFMMIRRKALEEAGGIDPSLPGGDDIDLSMRLKDAGYRLLAERGVFVYHHGQQTGQRLQPGFWSSEKHIEDTNIALIKKHGMRKFYNTMVKGWSSNVQYDRSQFSDYDIEGDICRKWVIGEKVAEMGCGGRKTVENAVGVDLHRAFESIPFVDDKHVPCVSDKTGDVSKDEVFEKNSLDTIISRHILEHCQDPIGTISLWTRMLKSGGRLIIAVPHNGLANTIMMNPEHCISFVPTSLEKMANVCGLKSIFCEEHVNGTSFVMVFEKVEHVLFARPVETVRPLAALMA